MRPGSLGIEGESPEAVSRGLEPKSPTRPPLGGGERPCDLQKGMERICVFERLAKWFIFSRILVLEVLIFSFF